MRRVALLGTLTAIVACTATETTNTPALKLLSPDGVRHSQPSYSSDGKRVAYWAPATGAAIGSQLWVANADFTAPVQIPVTVSLFGQVPIIWSPDDSQIASYSSDFGAGDVVIVPSNGGAARRLTNEPGVEIPLAWGPDPDKMFYYGTHGASVQSFRISVKTGATSQAIPSEKRPMAAIPSPDGKLIAYNLFVGEKATIWFADSTGANPTQVTTEGFEQISFPFLGWSPDSKQLVYESRRTGKSDLWVVSVADNKPRQLTHDIGNDFAAAWSSDGKWIAFLSDRGKQNDVWIVPSAGGADLRVTDSREDELAALQWRPGTNELAFATRQEKNGVYAMDVADGKERLLTPDSIRTNWFEVSPSGKDVLYVITHGGVSDLAVVPTAGGPTRVLLAGGGSVVQPLWSPDGSKIAFISDRGGTQDLWVIDAAGGAPRQLVNWPGYETFATWSKDGADIYFISDREARLADIWRVPAAGGEPKRITTDGSIAQIVSRRGVDDILVSYLNAKGGQFALSKLTAAGKLEMLWEKTNAFPGQFTPSGDSLIALVEQPDGKQMSMMLSARTGAGRVILTASDQAMSTSNDGKSLLFRSLVNGAGDVSVLNIADGKIRRLTTTADDELAADWTSDGKTVVFLRSKRVERIGTVDLTKIMKQ